MQTSGREALLAGRGGRMGGVRERDCAEVGAMTGGCQDARRCNKWLLEQRNAAAVPALAQSRVSVPAMLSCL